MKILKQQFPALMILLLLVIAAIVPQPVAAQSAYKLTADKAVSIRVLGTSNVHDWTMVSNAMESQGDFKFDKDNQLTALNAFSFSMAAKSLKSEHASMDDRTYKTMKADQYPQVSYKLISAAVIPLQQNKYTLKTTGALTIAGVTQNIDLLVTASVNPDHSITCSGSHNLKLTDFRIDPPTFMLGAMKVKNDLTIEFSLIYKNNQVTAKAN